MSDIPHLAKLIPEPIYGLYLRVLIIDYKWRVRFDNQPLVGSTNLRRPSLLNKNYWKAFPDLVGTEVENKFKAAANDKTRQEFMFYYPAFGDTYKIVVIPLADYIVVHSTAQSGLENYEKLMDKLLADFESKL